jgi:hypothetical protein
MCNKKTVEKLKIVLIKRKIYQSKSQKTSIDPKEISNVQKDSNSKAFD